MTELYRKAPAQSSGNRAISRAANPHLQLAARVARQLGMVPTWPNVQTIRLAIVSEAELLGIPVEDAAEVIVKAAKEASTFSQYVCPSQWERREIYRENSIDRFWFEDARWRTKFVYAELCAKRRAGAQEEVR